MKAVAIITGTLVIALLIGLGLTRALQLTLPAKKEEKDP